jgi:3-phosphoshikimate 1-carboxyvinyltransferase
LKIKNLNLNPTRTKLLNILKIMGAKIKINIKDNDIEPIGDLEVHSSNLTNTSIDLFDNPNVIDEIPLLITLSPLLPGEFKLSNAWELKKKESNRLKSVVNNLKNLNIKVLEFDGGVSIKGPQIFSNGEVYTYSDHRIEMAFSILKHLVDAKIKINGPSTVSVSYPTFYRDLNYILQ